MAYTKSGDLAVGAPFELGEYRLNLTTQYLPGSDQTVIGTYCKLIEDDYTKTGTGSVTLDGDFDVLGWNVVANDTTADVYATIQWTAPLTEPAVLTPVKVGDVTNAYTDPETVITGISGGPVFAFVEQYQSSSSCGLVYVSANPATLSIARRDGRFPNVISVEASRSYSGVSAYTSLGVNVGNPATIGWPWAVSAYQQVLSEFEAAVVLINGGAKGPVASRLIARFAIDPDKAGGTGPDSDWGDPGDSGDPDTVLELTVTGALSGRHNDPLHDTSYSYLPSDQDSVAGYGCGGDGGHGGGGGAGASTIIVYKFATNKANSKEIICKPKRHGYGSGGGKGGKGGDGCILIYH